MEFSSSLTPLESGAFEYKYQVINHLMDPIPLNWETVGIAGIVGGDTDPNSMTDNVFTHTVLSNLPGIEIRGSASFDLPLSDDLVAFKQATIIANAIVPAPIPEPAGVVLLTIALVTISQPARKRK